MAKHDREMQKLGWTIEACESRTGQWIKLLYDPNWDREFGAYRAVRIERTAGKRVPLPWSAIKCGMVVRLTCRQDISYLILRVHPEIFFAADDDIGYVKFNHVIFTSAEYLDGTEWKPLWTEELGEEKIVEIVTE